MSKQKYVIKKQDVLDAQWLGSSEQTILYILKAKGAPIKGNFILKPELDNNWWSVEYDFKEGNLIYYVESKPRGMI